MKTVARKRARWIAPGLACALLAGFLWEAPESRSTRSGAMSTPTGAVELSTAPAVPQNDPIGGLEEAEAVADSERSHLPSDASILPVERVSLGSQNIEVIAGEVVAKFSSALSKAGRDGLVARLGSAILLDDPITGYVRLKVPKGQSLVAFQEMLKRTEGVVTAHPNVIMRGAGNRCNLSGSYYNYQWHLGRYQHTQTCNTMPHDPSSVVVAVLDTGVAYENYGGYVRASDLSTVPVVDPYDFVNNDSHANDDHMHGTHVATTALGVGKVNGVTPGATLMPIKVLDAENKGGELSLAQGIRWAVDHGAKVINMSLSFPVSYVPSGVLQDAITYASERGVVMVASSGNAGMDTLPYPAAFRDVLSVGAVRMKRLTNGTITEEVANYSNTGPGLDVVAYGGSLQYDANQDGWPDGILAQTIRSQNPASTSYFFYAGTSQAAAEVSGILAWLVAAGATPTQARDALLETATDLGDPGYDPLYGQGLVSLYNAVNSYIAQSPQATPKYFANILPVVYKASGKEWSVAKVRVVNQAGTPRANAKVYGQWSGSASSKVTGTTDASGYVTFSSPQVTDDADGAIFALEINTIVDPSSGRRVRPKEFFYMSQGLAALLDGALSDEATQQSMMAFEVDPTDNTLSTHFDLAKLSRSFTIKAIGPGLGTPGIGITFTPDFIPGLDDESLPKQDITIQFGGAKAFGHGSSSSGVVRVYNGGVGLAMSSFGRSGGVGLAMSAFGRLGGVGLAMSTFGKTKLDSAMISGMAADESAAELVLNEAPESFLAANPVLQSSTVGATLSLTRFAVNTTDVAVMDGIISANSIEEAEALLNVEMGATAEVVELGEEAASLPLITEE